MNEHVERLKREVIALKKRNQRVEADKAWETSVFRIASICVSTYFIAVAVFYIIGSEHYFLNAWIPTVGYFLSIQTLPTMKRWWTKKYFYKHGQN